MGNLASCFTGDRLVNADGFAEAMENIAGLQPLSYYAGVKDNTNQQLTKYKGGIDWQDVFFPITGVSVYNLLPLSASATSLTGRPYVQR